MVPGNDPNYSARCAVGNATKSYVIIPDNGPRSERSRDATAPFGAIVADGARAAERQRQSRRDCLSNIANQTKKTRSVSHWDVLTLRVAYALPHRGEGERGVAGQRASAPSRR